jgi:hypothetical protein
MCVLGCRRTVTDLIRTTNVTHLTNRGKYALEDSYEGYRCVRTFMQVQLLQILIKPSSDATWLMNYPCDGRILKELLSSDDNLMQRRMTGPKVGPKEHET